MGNRGHHFFFLWFGAAISISEILTGMLLAPLGWEKGLVVILLGHLIGTTLLVLAGVIGTKEQMSAMGATSLAFGNYGRHLFASLNMLQLLGWTAVMLVTGASSLSYVAEGIFLLEEQWFGTLVLGGLILLWILLGKKGFRYINIIAVSLLLLLTLVLFGVILMDNTANGTHASGLSFGMGLELTVIMPLSWLPVIADFNRKSKSVRGAAIGSWLGFFIGSSWMYVIGLLLGMSTSAATPGALLAAANLGLVAIGIIILSTVTTTFLDAYSAGVSFTNIIRTFGERKVAVVMTIIGMGIAIIVPMTHYESFLYAIGSVFAPLYAIVLMNYFVLKNRERASFRKSVSALVVWAIGVSLYYVLVDVNFFLGATIPVMGITASLYFIVERVLRIWSARKQSQAFVKG